MAPLRTAEKSDTAAVQTTAHQGRNACRQVMEEVDEDTHVDGSMDVDDEAEDDETYPSQGTAVQNMIIGGLSNVWQSMHACGYL